MTFKTKLLAVVLLSVAGLYATPYWAVYRLRSAAEAHDAATLAHYVDFSALRKNLSTALNNEFKQALPSPADSALGAEVAAGVTALAASTINVVVDRVCSPAGLDMLLAGKRLPDVETEPAAKAPTTSAEVSSTVSMGYEAWDRFVITVDDHADAESKLWFVLKRQGLLDWKLAEIRL